jgi:hypothetical protein
MHFKELCEKPTIKLYEKKNIFCAGSDRIDICEYWKLTCQSLHVQVFTMVNPLTVRSRFLEKVIVARLHVANYFGSFHGICKFRVIFTRALKWFLFGDELIIFYCVTGKSCNPFLTHVLFVKKIFNETRKHKECYNKCRRCPSCSAMHPFSLFLTFNKTPENSSSVTETVHQTRYCRFDWHRRVGKLILAS